jgi:hypothetical protein
LLTPENILIFIKKSSLYIVCDEQIISDNKALMLREGVPSRLALLTALNYLGYSMTQATSSLMNFS